MPRLPRVAPRLLLTCLACVVIGCALQGCVLTPAGTAREQKALTGAGTPYAVPMEHRDLPYVPYAPTAQQVLQRAFYANGDLEAAYEEWKQAVIHIDEAGAYPNTPLAVGFNYLFSADRLTAWDRTTLSGGVDPQTDLAFPTKVAQAAKVALAQAREAADRFRAAKFDLQRRVLWAWWDLVAMDQDLQIESDDVELLDLLVQTAEARVQSGGPQQDLLKARIDQRLATNALAEMDAQHLVMVSGINAFMDRDPEASILAPTRLPEPTTLPADDATLITVGVDANADLSEWNHRVEDQQQSLELAKMGWIPDINPDLAMTGSLSQAASAVVILPFTTPRFFAQVREARAMLLAAQARQRQEGSDRFSQFIGALLILRDDERAASLMNDQVLPEARAALELSRNSYATGAVPFADLIDAQRTLLQVRRMIVQARTDREKQLATLDALAGVDLTTVKPLPFFAQRPRAAQAHIVPRGLPQPPKRSLSTGERFVQ